MTSHLRRRCLRPTRKPSIRPILEDLERRVVLSSARAMLPIIEIHHVSGGGDSGPAAGPDGIVPLDFGSPTPIGYIPSQIDTAYGLNNIMFGGIKGDGSGQTIAIVDAFDEPAFVDSKVNGQPNPAFAASDLAQFDQTFDLPDPPSFTKYNQAGQLTSLPGTDPSGAGNLNGTWELEESLDVEWAHAIAPGASIDLVEASSTSNNSLFTAVATAAGLPGVSVISMSWGLDEFQGEQAVDSSFTTPAGHQGVTFLAASGDQGSPGYFPAYSPNVVSTGGTTLNLKADNTYLSETAWSGSGGGTSLYEPEPAYQTTVQSTGQRTIPDVAWDADPATGVAVYDSWDDTDNSGPWLDIGGTSVASPSWSGLIAIVNQGRVLARGGTLNGRTETLPALYSVPETDFHDITRGSNGDFNAGPGYDQVTGLGTPKANLLIPDLVAYGTATQIAVTNQPPQNVIAGDPFGFVVSAENSQGGVDKEFSGTVTISLATNPTGATLGGTLTATASDGQAVFNNLTLNKAGTGFVFKVTSSGFAAIQTAGLNVINNPTPSAGTFYPVGSDASLRAAISQADSNSFANNTIVLSVGTYALSNPAAGQIVIQNTSALPSKTLTIIGAGEASTVIQPEFFPWQDRLFEIVAPNLSSLSVTFENLTLKGGNATGGGILGGNAALGGAVLIDGGTVAMTSVAISNNVAQGARGADGHAGDTGQAGGDGGAGGNARGGGIYLGAGSLTLTNDVLSGNIAQGGAGGSGGNAGNVNAVKSPVATTGGAGGNGGNAGTAAGGAMYVAGGKLVVADDTFATNQAAGGFGGNGGRGGDGILGKPGGNGGNGGQAGLAEGGAIFLSLGSVTLELSTFQGNSAIGGAGGTGGAGGPGSSLLVSSSAGITVSSGSIFGSNTNLTQLFHGGPGGNGGNAGNGAAGQGGGLYVGGGTLTLFGVTLSKNQALGGQGGFGGSGATAGIGSLSILLGGGTGTVPIGGSGGSGGDGGAGSGGGLYLAGGTVTLIGDTFNGNLADGGAGGTGGRGGNGAFAGGLSGLGGLVDRGYGASALESPRHKGAGPGGNRGLHVAGGAEPMLAGTTTGPTAPGLPSGGPGGDGGIGGQARGGAIFVAAGTLTLFNDTVAQNSVQGGAAGIGGAGGNGGSSGLGNGPSGSAGQPGAGSGGGGYVAGGTVNLYNTTIALNTQTGAGSGGGVVQVAGTVTAVSTIFAGNGPVDYSGKITANNSLFQTAPASGTITGAANLTGIAPLFATAGLASNGGPTQTIALQSGSLAIGAGANPESLFTDQRGDSPRGGAGSTDIGAFEHNATADATRPTATLAAPAVTASNAATLNPYTFTVTYADNTAIAVFSLAGAVVSVTLPGGGAIVASVVSTSNVGLSDAVGDAQGIKVTYQITPPGGSWTPAGNGTYTVSLAGAPVTDLTGNAVAPGTLGTFSVNIASSPATAVLVGRDPNTQGNWLNAYGAQGYNIINSTSAYPSYATVTTTGVTAFTWAASTSDPRALQTANGQSRIAAGWYGASSFSFDVNLNDGKTHDISLYLLDWDTTNARNEQIQLTNAVTGTVLDTEKVSSFSAGVYLEWAISGNVLFTVTKLGGPNIVLSGLFFDADPHPLPAPPPPPPPSPGTASFVGKDTLTQGTWMGAYGAQGYNIINSTTAYPSYATVTTTGVTAFTWVASTSDVRALQTSNGQSRIAAGWYAASSFSINVNITDGKTHDISLYFLDWDGNNSRNEQVQITNSGTGAVLDTEKISSFSGGAYLEWAVSGHVIITVSKLGGPNIVMSGMFFDADPHPLPGGPPPPPPPVATASFVDKDAKTQGTWLNVYGAQGFNLINSTAAYPSYATVTTTGTTAFTWVASTTDVRALQTANGQSRIAAGWYAASSFSINMNLTDGKTHDISLYFLDWDGNNTRSEQIQITNAATGAVLDTEKVSSFSSGDYLEWAISGHVIITVTKVGGANIVLSGLFFDAAGGAPAAMRGSATGRLIVSAPPLAPGIAGISLATSIPAANSTGASISIDIGIAPLALGSAIGTTIASDPLVEPHRNLIYQDQNAARRLFSARAKSAARQMIESASGHRHDLRRHPLVRRKLSAGAPLE
jgi:hypothetical protein